MDNQNGKLRYDNLDGLRALAAIGIICMHVRANIGFEISGGEVTDYTINYLIASMSSFVSLFFIISSFSMCCGYYEKIKDNQISLNTFYSRRYWRILPFFALLVLIDLIVDIIFYGGIEISNIYEAFADLTLMFGFFSTKEITVIGVGWTLGVIFGFYILFPFFVFLIWNKKRAWFSLVLLLLVNYVCGVYFLVDDNSIRANCLRWLCYFITGGLIYLYRSKIADFYKKACGGKAVQVSLLLILAGLVIVYIFDFQINTDIGVLIKTIQRCVGYSLVVIGAIGPTTVIWSNKVSRFISEISLEIYLSHMLIFRVIEKLGLTTLFGTGLASYFLSCVLTIVGSIIFAEAYQVVEHRIKKIF